jgi:hypothetical protein
MEIMRMAEEVVIMECSEVVLDVLVLPHLFLST